MLSWIIQIIIISVLFIYLIHHLICFFKNALTIPKTKDLIDSSSRKYDRIFSILNHNKNNHKIFENSNNSYTTLDDGTYIDLLPNPSSDSSMKDELKNFLKEQLNDEGLF
jgi:hypothetical protein